jgi:hypothetical protein
VANIATRHMTCFVNPEKTEATQIITQPNARSTRVIHVAYISNLVTTSGHLAQCGGYIQAIKDIYIVVREQYLMRLQ